jgi:hypothetical protein
MIQQINDYFNKIGKIFKRTSDNSIQLLHKSVDLKIV